jgi:hypothetical protein
MKGLNDNSMLSNSTKLKDLRERLIDIEKNERNGLLIIPLGVFLVGAGLIFCAILSSELALVGGIFLSALGIFSTFFGFCVAVHYVHQYNDLLKELEHTVH